MKHPLKAGISALRKHHLHVRRFRPGSAPGSLDAPQGPSAAAVEAARVRWIRYAASGTVEERDGDDLQALPPAPAADAQDVTWVHIQGEPGADQLQALGNAFGLHPLALEDVYKHEARAKAEEYGTQQFVVLNHVCRDADGNFSIEQLSFFLGANYLISINPGPPDLFEPVRQRLRAGAKIRQHGADYLLYALLDMAVDSGFPLLEELGDRLEDLEDQILDNPTREARNQIHYAKRELVLMRRAWWPQREVISTLMRDNERFLSNTTRLYLRDCYDHCVIAIDFVEAYREMASSLLDTYLSAVSQRMNDIMKGLTIVATIFLPLMFLTGLYGMNFDTQSPYNMPELHWRFGYFYVLSVMAAVVVAMLVYFRRKRWM